MPLPSHCQIERLLPASRDPPPRQPALAHLSQRPLPPSRLLETQSPVGGSLQDPQLLSVDGQVKPFCFHFILLFPVY